jgi:hypothetical protein
MKCCNFCFAFASWTWEGSVWSVAAPAVSFSSIDHFEAVRMEVELVGLTKDWWGWCLECAQLAEVILALLTVIVQLMHIKLWPDATCAWWTSFFFALSIQPLIWNILDIWSHQPSVHFHLVTISALGVHLRIVNSQGRLQFVFWLLEPLHFLLQISYATVLNKALSIWQKVEHAFRAGLFHIDTRLFVFFNFKLAYFDATA